MAITYTWDVKTMDTAVSEDGLSDVVKIIHWRYTAQEETYFATVYGTIGVDAPNPDQFTPFDSLTEEQVISWVESKLDMNEIKSSLEKQIDNQKAPPIVTKQGNW